MISTLADRLSINTLYLAFLPHQKTTAFEVIPSHPHHVENNICIIKRLYNQGNILNILKLSQKNNSLGGLSIE